MVGRVVIGALHGREGIVSIRLFCRVTASSKITIFSRIARSAITASRVDKAAARRAQ